jgi:hypothetical protein
VKEVENLVMITNFDPKPTVDEVEGLIARNEKVSALWKGNPDYYRGLQIEIFALRLLLEQMFDAGQRTILTCADLDDLTLGEVGKD